MKFISAFFALLILVPVLCFALPNRQDVDVALWPFDGAASVPLYLVGLLPLLFGLLFGGFWGWLAGVPHRFKARRLHKELTGLKAAKDQPQPTRPTNPFWKRQK